MQRCQSCFLANALPRSLLCGDCGGARGAGATWEPEPERSETRSARYHRARRERERAQVRPHTVEEIAALHVLAEHLRGALS